MGRCYSSTHSRNNISMAEQWRRRRMRRPTLIFPRNIHRNNIIMIMLMPLIVIVMLTCHIPTANSWTNDQWHSRNNFHVPCTFFDTVNVTDDAHFENGSYLHHQLMIPHELIGSYDFTYKNMLDRQEVAPHQRACICKLRPCINFCCPWGQVFNSNSSGCVNSSEVSTSAWPQPVFNVTMDDGSVQLLNIFQHFGVQSFRPCANMFSLVPEIHEFDTWTLFENGTLLRIDDQVYMNKNEYCFVPTAINSSDEFFVINPANCDLSQDQGTMKIINAYTMLFSIPFMVLTIAVYLAIPELRNQHGKSLVCYLIGLIVGYTMLSTISLNSLDPNELTCKIVGYTAYFFFMSAFFWLSVISFDLWHNFRGTRSINRLHEKKRFLIYSLYAWGLAIAFLVFTWCAQELTDWPSYYKPSIGDEGFCWIDMRSWSAMIYFFGPIVIIIIANTVMFIMTAFKIHKVQREMARITAREDCNRNLRTEKDKFGLFLRLFIVMGVTWSMEIMSYFVGSDKSWAKVFYISDLCNAMQGFLIFMLFVMKKKVKHLITNRYSVTRESSRQRQSQYSTKTTSSSVPNLTNLNLNSYPINNLHQQAEKPLLSKAM